MSDQTDAAGVGPAPKLAGAGTALPPPPQIAATKPAAAAVKPKADPRRADQIRKIDYKLAVPVDDSTYEWMTIVAMVTGMAGVMLKVTFSILSLQGRV